MNPDDPIERNFGIINNFFMSLECPGSKDLEDGNNVSHHDKDDYVNDESKPKLPTHQAIFPPWQNYALNAYGGILSSTMLMSGFCVQQLDVNFFMSLGCPRGTDN